MQKFALKSAALLIAVGLGASPSWAGESKHGDSHNDGMKRDNVRLHQLQAASRHFDSPGKKAGLGRLFPKAPSFGCR